MKVYVASRFSNREKVKNVMELFRKRGHEITVDWTSHKDLGDRGFLGNEKVAEKYAKEDIDGVRNCDVFVLLTTADIGAGMHTELGVAILSNILFGKPRIFVVGEHLNNCVFYFHPVVERRKSVEEVLREIE